MRTRLGVAIAALSGAMCMPASAHAQHIEGRAAIALSGTYTKILSDVPNASGLPVSGPSLSVAPSLSLLLETPRTMSTFAYSFGLTAPLGDSNQALLYTNLLAYTLRAELDPRTTLVLSANGSEAPINTLVTAQDPSQTQVQAAPTGATALFQLNGGESLARQINENTGLAQTTSVTYGYVYDPFLVRPRTLSVTNNLALSRMIRRDTLSLSLSNASTYFSASEGGSGGAYVAPQTAIATTLSAIWGRQLTPALSSSVTLGATHVYMPDVVGGSQVIPTGAASLTYSVDFAVAALAYSHQQMANIVLGTTTVSDQAILRFSLPIGQTGFLTSASAGFTHSVPLGGTVSTSGGTPSMATLTTDVALADAQLAYVPAFAPTCSTSVRGLLSRQVAETDATGSYTRWSLSLTVAYYFPNPARAQVPPALAVPTGGVPFGGGEPAPVEEVPPEPGLVPVEP